jgi:diguanylate cyclase (GGDEF)-like protein
MFKRTDYNGALLFIDLDHFKVINDTLGHGAGDRLLQQVSKRLSACVREGDTVSRFGGDEFVVMLEDLSKNSLSAANKAEMACEKLLADLSEPYELKGRSISVSASIGVTMFSKDSSAKELLKQSDIALYQAKASGRNAIRFFDPQMQQAVDERAAIEAEIKEGLLKEQFELHYQLQVNDREQPLGVEALLRLKHPEKGYVSPMQYIPVAEETGLIIQIGNWVLNTACKQLKRWEGDKKTKELTIAVNVSSLEFKEASFVDNVLLAIRSNAINPSRLKLELTETMLVDDIEQIILKMAHLKDEGVQFSLDDFGTGYSSLQYLKQLPLDQLKIDQSFVRDLESDPQDRSIVQTVIVMAKGLELDVIAEGVENEQQKEMLFGFGCKNYQGYLFSKPVPINELEQALERG